MRLISEMLRGLRAGAGPGLLAVATALAVVLPMPGATAAHRAPTPPPSSDRVKAWGNNDAGQLGDATGFSGAGNRRTAVAVAGLTEASVRAVSAGVEGQHSLAVLRNGTVEAWGDNTAGQLGDGTSGTIRTTPGTVGGLHDVVAVAAGQQHSLALLKGGTVMAWGANDHGQLGCEASVCTSGGVADMQPTPVPVKFPPSVTSKVIAIAAGNFHSLALLKDGSVFAWGQNSKGQLGTGSPGGEQPTPVATLLTSGVQAIAAGAEHSLARLKDNTVKAWGNNGNGQLGLPATTMQTGTPTAVMGLSGVSAIAAGAHHSLAVLSTGTVKAWGQNNHGQLGCAASVCTVPGNEFAPVPVSGLAGVKAVAGGAEHSLALLSDGNTVKAWGHNDAGQLGDGTTTAEQHTPVTIRTGLTGITTLTAGFNHSLAG